MKIKEIYSLEIPEIKVLKFERFLDNRGYFTEPYRFSQLREQNIIDEPFTQMNVSSSHKDVIRGLHFQWNPYMEKLVRTISGHMVDLALDIRLNSPTFAKIIAFDMPALNGDEDVWIWIPKGFAHGNYFLEESKIEYLCSGEYSPQCEAGISPFAKDIDWSLCDRKLHEQFLEISKKSIVSDKDKSGLTIDRWTKDLRANNFTL